MVGLLAGKRILIVEDNVGNWVIANMLLERAGAKVFFERWGTRTIEVAESVCPLDCIVLDLMFPRGISGYDIFERFKQCPRLSSIPVVLVTAADAVAEMPKARGLGFSGFIGKPVSFMDFSRQIADVISGEKIWSAR
jgi:CheY-like chemotaxis protein